MTSPGGTLGTWHRFVYERSIPVFQGLAGIRFLGTVAGLTFDTISQALLDAFRAPMLQDELGPAYDALRPLGEEMSMPQYADETWEQYRSRLRTAWDTWAKAGDETTIINQLALAGRPNAQIFRFGFPESWSRFMVFYAAGDHPVTGQASTYGTGAYGDGTKYGVTGITNQQLSTYQGLIKHWKPARWACPYIIWELTGSTYGTGHTYGEVGLTYGGTQARSDVQVLQPE